MDWVKRHDRYEDDGRAGPAENKGGDAGCCAAAP
jgi:hypothetical protein